MKHSVKEIHAGPDILAKARQVFDRNSEELESYINLLLSWNEKINLVSRNVSRETVREHIIHSLLPEALNLLDSFDTWIDAGSGGGLPGIPLAICKKEKKWILNDNVRKKMRAADDMIHSLKLNNCSVESKSISLVDFKKGTGIVTKHAFKIEDLIRLLGKKPWQKILMWKGADDAIQEIGRSHKRFNATLYRFGFGNDEPFYEGKALILIEN